jgi:hypothetical protein
MSAEMNLPVDCSSAEAPDGTPDKVDNGRGRLTTCRVEQLRAHPAYVRHEITVTASKLSAIADLGGLAFREPLATTHEGVILDGYARFELARLQKRETLRCLLYQLTEAESLQWLLQCHRQSNGLSDFTRILLALDLEPWLREKALAHQRVGGQKKGSSIMTEAERLDVRSEIARSAKVSVGNVSKVRQLIGTAHPEVVQALRGEEIRIHRAWLWHKELPQEQLEALWNYRSKRGIRRTVRQLISRHQSKSPTIPPAVADLVRHLPALDSGRQGPVKIVVIRGSGKAIYLTEELSHSIGAQKDLALTCAMGNR